jgi:hypothetical protein
MVEWWVKSTENNQKMIYCASYPQYSIIPLFHYSVIELTIAQIDIYNLNGLWDFRDVNYEWANRV